MYIQGRPVVVIYPLMWNVTMEYTATHFNILGQTRSGIIYPTVHIDQRTLNFILNFI